MDDFLERILQNKCDITPFLQSLKHRLDNKLDDTGQRAWEYVAEEYRNQLYTNDMEWYWVRQLKEGWFGDNRVENAEQLRKICGILQSFRLNYEAEEKKKMKMLLPVGLLVGSLFVILLI